MSEDFVRLVTSANPAFRQYQPANTGYPPSGSSPQHHTQLSFDAGGQSGQLDPFFDDDDDVPDSAFGPPRHGQAMQSKESGLPLTRNAALPAGIGGSQISLPPDHDILQDWDDDISLQGKRHSLPFSGSKSFPGTSSAIQEKGAIKTRKKWKWPWQKSDEVLEGERIVALNNPTPNVGFCSNYISTSKYNAVTFVPKFLFGMFILPHLVDYRKFDI